MSFPRSKRSRNNEAINANFKAVYDRLEILEANGDRPRGEASRTRRTLGASSLA
jgi:hypothetical protein